MEVWEGKGHTAVCKMEDQQHLPYTTWNSARGSATAWMGGELGGVRMHLCVWLSPSPAHLKLSQHC